MKKKMPLVIAILLFMILFAGYVCLLQYNEKQELSESEDVITVLNIEKDNVKRIQYEMDGEVIAFTKTEENWSADGNDSFVVDDDKVESVVSALVEMTANRKMEKVSDLKEYGLDEPVQVVSLTDADGTETAIYWGSNNSVTGDDYLYVSGDEKTVYTVASDVQGALLETLEEYREEETSSTEE